MQRKPVPGGQPRVEIVYLWLNPDKAHVGSGTHGLLAEITYLVSGLNEAQVLDVALQKDISETHSGMQEVDLFKEKHPPQTESGTF